MQAYSELTRFIDSYHEDSVDIMDSLSFSQYETLKTIEYYSNSRYLDGQRDHLGREKPFYNISKFRVNVAVRATDLDIKDFQLDSDQNNDQVITMLAQKELYLWMKEANFGKVLNDFGVTRAKYGGVVIKKEESRSELKLHVVDWNKLVTDQIDISSGAIAELHYLSPSELNRKRGVWENIDEAIAQAGRERRAGKSIRSQASSDRVEVWELHGEFPISYLKEARGEEITEEDHFNYSEQVYFFAGEVLLYADEAENPYKYLAWESVPGRALGWGIVEDGLEAQVWTNDAIISQKNALDIAGKVIAKTNAMSLADNLFTDVDNGQIIELGAGEDINLLNLTPSSLPMFERVISQWDRQYERVSSTYDATTGATMPSNTPFRSVALQNQEGTSYFLYRMEEASIFWQEVFNDWVLPWLFKKINREHILASNFTPEELAKIDQQFSTYSANQKALELIMQGKMVTAEEYQEYVENYGFLLAETGEKRFIEVPKNYFKDFQAKMSLIITGENKNKAVLLESLSNILQTVGQAPHILEDPTLAKIFARIVELSGAGISIPSPTASRGRPSEGGGEVDPAALIEQVQGEGLVEITGTNPMA